MLQLGLIWEHSGDLTYSVCPTVGEFDARACQIPTIAPYKPEGGVVGEYIDRCIIAIKYLSIEYKLNQRNKFVCVATCSLMMSICSRDVITIHSMEVDYNRFNLQQSAW